MEKISKIYKREADFYRDSFGVAETSVHEPDVFPSLVTDETLIQYVVPFIRFLQVHVVGKDSISSPVHSMISVLTRLE